MIMPNQSFIKVDFDMKAAKKGMTHLQKSQFPFVLAKSLTQTAEGARQAVGVQTRREFHLHSEFIPRNIKKQPAKKKDIQNYGIAESAVFTGKKLDGWMGAHEWGGIKKPAQSTGRDKGKALALPGSDILTKSFKTSTGKVKVRWKPKALLKDYKGKGSGRQKGRKKTRARKPFIIKPRNTAMVVRRKSKMSKPLEILYVFKSKAKINPTWGFRKTVRRYVNFAFRKKFDRNMAMAIR
jgi:hypothetical protein